MPVGVVSTARITHATPAATYSHIDNRDDENAIALQALPGAATYNTRLRDGVDVVFGGGRQFFVPCGALDEEGGDGSRGDGRDLRREFQQRGYKYVWNTAGFGALTHRDAPVLGLFERSDMEYEYDRPADTGGEPSLTDMTLKAIELLRGAGDARKGRGDRGYFLMVESGRIDQARHEGSAFRALTDTAELDRAIGAALQAVDLRDTLVIVSADPSHVFKTAGYPLRPLAERPFSISSHPPGFESPAGYGILDVVHRVDPATGPQDQACLQQSAVPIASETHSGEDVGIYAVGPGAELVRGTVRNTHIYYVMAAALGIR
jgi:alkaline phosphatase